MSAGERRLLHGDVAGVLETLYAGHTAEIAAELGAIIRKRERMRRRSPI